MAVKTGQAPNGLFLHLNLIQSRPIDENVDHHSSISRVASVSNGIHALVLECVTVLLKEHVQAVLLRLFDPRYTLQFDPGPFCGGVMNAVHGPHNHITQILC